MVLARPSGDEENQQGETTHFGFTDVPLGEKQVREAQSTRSVKAPVRARLVVPVQMVPGLIAALQDNFRLYQDSFGPTKGTSN